MSGDDSSDVVTADELADRLGCTDVQVVRWIEHDWLVAVEQGPPWVIRKADANAWSKSKGAGVLFPEAGMGQRSESAFLESEEETPEHRAASVTPEAEAEQTAGDEQLQQFNPLKQKARSRTRDDIKDLSNVSSEDEAQVYFERGADAYESLNLEPAHHYFKKAHAAAPDEPLYAAFYAYVRFMNEPAQAGSAEELLKDIADGAEPEVKAYVHLFCGRILKANDRQDEAKEQFKQAIRENPDFDKARTELRRFRSSDATPDPDNQSGIRTFLEGWTGKD